jgi:hypothetical protein
MYTSAGIEFLHRLRDLASRKLFYNLFERRFFLPYDLVQSSRLDACFLQLLIRFARFNGMVLACVTNQQYTVISFEPVARLDSSKM